MSVQRAAGSWTTRFKFLAPLYLFSTAATGCVQGRMWCRRYCSCYPATAFSNTQHLRALRGCLLQRRLIWPALRSFDLARRFAVFAIWLQNAATFDGEWRCRQIPSRRAGMRDLTFVVGLTPLNDPSPFLVAQFLMNGRKPEREGLCSGWDRAERCERNCGSRGHQTRP